MAFHANRTVSIFFLLYQAVMLFALVPLLIYVRLARPAEMAERMGRVAAEPGEGRLWVHAASLGEFEAVLPIVRAIGAEVGWNRIMVSCTNVTARDQIRSRLPAPVIVSLAPFDLWFLVRRALRRTKPSAVLFAETEIWPAWVVEAWRSHVPLVLFSARISPSSARRYMRFRAGLAPVLRLYDAIGCRTGEDRDRFVALGAPEDRCEVWGNTKYDAGPAPLRNHTHAGRALLVLGSVRPGEEGVVTAVAPLLRDGTRLFLVPRHVGTADRWERVALEAGLTVRRLSSTGLEIRPDSASWKPVVRASNGSLPDVVLVDCVGLLAVLYGAADAAVVGGTFVDIGGHSLFEPAREGCPVLFGPSLHGVRDIADLLLSTGGGVLVKTPQALGPALADLLHDRDVLAARSDAARRAAVLAAGAVARTLERLTALGISPAPRRSP